MHIITCSSLLWKFMVTGRVLTSVMGQGLRTMKGQNSGPWRGKNGSGCLAMTRGMDFRGNTSSAVAKLLSSEEGTDAFSDVFSSGFSDGFSVAAGFVAGDSVISVETDDVVVSRLTWPKNPSKISSSEEVSMPTRAILILPKPSLWSCVAFLSKWEANSSKCKPWKICIRTGLSFRKTEMN